jgi:GntR family transcriptional regulator, transcriptional repressor for pyruvate dehydrogenase complex
MTDSTTSNSDRTPWFESDRAEKIPEMTARGILRTIVNDGLEPGDMMPAEAVMLKQFGIGRASLREALRILETHGVIRIKPGPGGGPVVAKVTSADYGRTMTLFLQSSHATIRELLEARVTMEPIMARLAAARVTHESAARLKAAATECWDTIATSAWPSASEEFYETLASASGNRVLDLFSQSLVSISRQRLGSMYPVDKREPICKMYDRIAEAVKAGNQSRAETLTRKNLETMVAELDAGVPRQLDEVIDWR